MHKFEDLYKYNVCSKETISLVQLLHCYNKFIYLLDITEIIEGGNLCQIYNISHLRGGYAICVVTVRLQIMQLCLMNMLRKQRV